MGAGFALALQQLWVASVEDYTPNGNGRADVVSEISICVS